MATGCISTLLVVSILIALNRAQIPIRGPITQIMLVHIWTTEGIIRAFELVIY
jgi:hypothetical protein